MLRDEAQVAAFIRDWELGIPLAEMAALHGYRNVNSVGRAAQRLGLEKRKGGRPPVALSGGRWMPGRHGIMRWVADEAS